MNNAFFLDFERPIVELEEKIREMRNYAVSEDLDMFDELERLERKAEKLRHGIYSKLSRWQRVQLARHPQRPYTLDYVRLMTTDFVELHGDRLYGDDRAMVGGLARLDGEPVVLIGHQKGRNTEENLQRNFGYAHPEGYRKALRLMKLAAKFRRPVVCLIDTPGAYPGISAEERGVAESIAQNLFEMARLRTPVVVAVIGEGGSGGAIGVGVGDCIMMMENTWYSVISPESCSTILWKSREKKEDAAEALKLTAPDLLELGLIDEIVPEPVGGAHWDHVCAASTLKSHIVSALSRLRRVDLDDLVRQRTEKFYNMGVWEE